MRIIPTTKEKNEPISTNGAAIKLVESDTLIFKLEEALIFDKTRLAYKNQPPTSPNTINPIPINTFNTFSPISSNLLTNSDKSIKLPASSIFNPFLNTSMPHFTKSMPVCLDCRNKDSNPFWKG